MDRELIRLEDGSVHMATLRQTKISCFEYADLGNGMYVLGRAYEMEEVTDLDDEEQHMDAYLKATLGKESNRAI